MSVKRKFGLAGSRMVDIYKARMTKPASSRRRFISHTAAALTFAAARPWSGAAQPSPSTRTQLILLGTGGGPRPRKNSFSTSQVILVNNAAYVVDCGNGVAIQLARAGVSLPILRHVFITHHHSDHNADYGNLLLLAWAAGLQSRVDGDRRLSPA
jgi:hypothetical protein